LENIAKKIKSKNDIKNIIDNLKPEKQRQRNAKYTHAELKACLKYHFLSGKNSLYKSADKIPYVTFSRKAKKVFEQSEVQETYKMKRNPIKER